ncbi:MAG: hypothetical protein IJY20_03775 [Clostridia bacterium]|nr:hypothetical protein [Clostridia bacterium]
MTCTFFGHANTPDSIKDGLKKEIMRLIDEQNIKKFYVGNNGSFDFYVQNILEKITKARKDVQYNIVLSYINEHALNNCQNATVFPEGLENALPKFAIAKRNDWLIENADLVITYTEHKLSNCYKWVQKAMKKRLPVINLAEGTIAF